mgnify:CR=1 FL=1
MNETFYDFSNPNTDETNNPKIKIKKHTLLNIINSISVNMQLEKAYLNKIQEKTNYKQNIKDLNKETQESIAQLIQYIKESDMDDS